MSEPLVIAVDEERQAAALVRELVGVAGLVVNHVPAGWELKLDCAKTDRIVLRVLDAVQRTLEPGTAQSALVRFDGREYRMHAL